MKLLLIRHGETEHNVKCLLAGVTDSNLTNHGVLQTQRLGHYVADRGLRMSHVYASDLTRAYLTAKAVADRQNAKWPGQNLEVVKLSILREQDFGSLECTPWASRRDNAMYEKEIPLPSDPRFVPQETHEAMIERAEMFWDDFIMPILAMDAEEQNAVAVVSHGLFLSTLWRTLLPRFGPQNISLGPEVSSNAGGRHLQHLPGWANTGILELDIVPETSISNLHNTAVIADKLMAVGGDDTLQPSKKLLSFRMTIRMVNGRHHLNNLKRTRGGVGSATHDPKQKNLDGFFRKPTEEPTWTDSNG